MVIQDKEVALMSAVKPKTAPPKPSKWKSKKLIKNLVFSKGLSACYLVKVRR